MSRLLFIRCLPIFHGLKRTGVISTAPSSSVVEVALRLVFCSLCSVGSVAIWLPCFESFLLESWKSRNRSDSGHSWHVELGWNASVEVFGCCTDRRLSDIPRGSLQCASFPVLMLLGLILNLLFYLSWPRFFLIASCCLAMASPAVLVRQVFPWCWMCW